MPTQSKYKLLILDYGGTYSFEYDVNSFNYIMLTSFGKVPNTIQKESITELSHLLASASISTDNYVARVAEILDVTVPDTKVFEDATIEVTKNPSPEMKALLKLAHDKGIKVSLLSNMFIFEVKKTKLTDRYDGFDYVSFSAEAELTKSNPDFFKLTLDHFGIEADKALFVDDVAEYIHTAQSLGIHTIHADKMNYRNAAALANSIECKLNTKLSLS